MKLTFSLLLLFAISLGCSKSSENSVSEHIKSGQEYLNSFEFEKAKQEFIAAGKIDSLLPYGRLGEALVLERKGYLFDALNEYLNIKFRFELFAPAHEGIYRIYTQFGYYDKALKAAVTAHQLKPDNSSYFINRFKAAMNYDQWYLAQKLLEESGQSIDDASLKFMQARIYTAKNEFDSARSTISEAQAKNLQSSYQFELLADALEGLALIDSAMKVSRRATEMPDAGTTAFNTHFDRALRNNYYSDARMTTREFVNRGADSSITLPFEILIYKDKGEFSRAKVTNSLLSNKVPINISTMFFDLTASGPQYVDQMVVESNERQIKMEFERTDTYIKEMADLVRTELEYFKSTWSGADARLWYTLSELKGQFAHYRKIALASARVQYSTGQIDDALENLDKFRKSHGNQPDWLVEIADIYGNVELHMTELAQETYEQALNVDKWHRQAFIHKVKHLQRLGEFNQALKQFDNYPHFENEFDDVAMLKAELLAANKDFDAAINIVESKGATVKGNLRPFTQIMNSFERSYAREYILNLAEITSKWAENNTDIMLFSARYFCDEKEYGKSQQLAEKVLDIEPNSLEARVTNARSTYGMGNREKVLEMFDELIAEFPTDGDVTYYFSQILAGEKIDESRTLNMARSALRSFYDDEKSFINLTRAYLAFGKIKFARGEAATGLLEFPDSPQLWFLLGRASKEMGRDDAAENLKKAIEMGLKGDDLVTAKELLATL